MTEWHLQRQLTRDWLANQGKVKLAGEVFFLAAWEVMTDWRINDPRRHWSQPSIDFLLLDSNGHLAALELKTNLTGPRAAWAALCQVTHRAASLGSSYTLDRLTAAYDDCHRGRDGKAPRSDTVPPVVEAHASVFGTVVDSFAAVPVRRFVMACNYGRGFAAAHQVFTEGDADPVRHHIETYASAKTASKEFGRFLSLGNAPVVTTTPVTAVDLCGRRVV